MLMWGKYSSALLEQAFKVIFYDYAGHALNVPFLLIAPLRSVGHFWQVLWHAPASSALSFPPALYLPQMSPTLSLGCYFLYYTHRSILWKFSYWSLTPSLTTLARVLQRGMISRQIASYSCGDIRSTLWGLSSASWRLRKTSPKVTWRKNSFFVKGGWSTPHKAINRSERDFHAVVGYSLYPKYMTVVFITVHCRLVSDQISFTMA